MTKTSVALILFLFSINSFASVSNESKMKGFLLKVEFSYQDSGKSLRLENELIVHQETSDWVPLTPGERGVALLGRIQKSNKGIFTAEYMIVDTSVTPVAVQRMAIVGEPGKKVEISSEALPQKAKVSLLATPTEFTQEL